MIVPLASNELYDTGNLDMNHIPFCSPWLYPWYPRKDMTCVGGVKTPLADSFMHPSFLAPDYTPGIQEII
jgi:hypothetical protein